MARRPKHAPTPSTRAVVTALYSYGISQEHIAVRLGCNLSTLLRNYRKELDEAVPNLTASVVQALIRRALDPKSGMAGVKAAELYLKARAGWRDNFQNIEHSGDAGGPMGAGNQQVVLILPENSRDLPRIVSRAAPMMIEARAVEEGVIIESE